MNVKDRRTKDVCALSKQLLPDMGTSFIFAWILFFTEVNYNMPECACYIWPQPKSLESKRIMPFVQNLDLLLHLYLSSKDVLH